MPIKVREMIRILEQDGWYLVAFEGSHRHFKHDVKKGRVTVPGKLGSDLRAGTHGSILRQAELREK